MARFTIKIAALLLSRFEEVRRFGGAQAGRRAGCLGGSGPAARKAKLASV
jgi:hypothetical protein